MNKKRTRTNINLTLLIGTLIVILFVNNTIFPLKVNSMPDNSLIHKELIIPNTGKYSKLYVDEIKKDRGSQQIGLSVEKKGKDLHIYVLAHKTSGNQVKEYISWLTGYYGAEEVKD